MGLWAGKCVSEARLDGKTAIITGANSGIGKHTALDFYNRGCRVIMACRDTDKAEMAKDEIWERLKDAPETGKLVVRKLDLASVKSIKSFADNILKQESKIDLLINNGGILYCPQSYTEDGFELQFGTNYLGHFLLTVLLLPRLIESGSARIVVLSSVNHLLGTIEFDNLNSEKSYGAFQAYNNSKLANILFVTELARKLEGTDVKVYAVNPGIVKTEIDRQVKKLIYFPGQSFLYNWVWFYLIKTPEQGAQTTIYCAVDKKTGNETGHYYENCKIASPSAKATDKAVAKKLWNASWDLLKLNDYDPFKIKKTSKECVTNT